MFYYLLVLVHIGIYLIYNLVRSQRGSVHLVGKRKNRKFAHTADLFSNQNERRKKVSEKRRKRTGAEQIGSIDRGSEQYWYSNNVRENQRISFFTSKSFRVLSSMPFAASTSMTQLSAAASVR